MAASTKRDIEALGDKLRAEFYKSQNSQTRTLVFGMVSVMLVLATLAFGAASLV